ncbi:MAG TPA: oligoendopeptidase F [Prolixibacteraceae bacterium]|nr:oligoendopeptidase F [Prolixibacteraceae bacterium]
MKRLLLLNLAILLAITVFGQKERNAIDEKDKWNLSDLYPTEKAWEEARDKVVAEMPEIEQFKGKLTKSSADLLACLEFSSKLDKEASRLFIYTSMNSDQDTRDSKFMSMQQSLEQIFADYGTKTAFIEPEILSVDWKVIEGFIKEQKGLAVYEKDMIDLFKQKEHSLSEPEERILARSSMISGVANDIYGTFKDAEMPAPEVTLSDNTKIKLTASAFNKLRTSPNRADRQIAFEAFWKNYANYKATYGQMLYGNVKGHIFRAQSRKYSSAIEASLSPKDIPVAVYQSLVDNVNKNLPAFHRYLAIKKRMLGVDTLKYLDLYAPVVKNVDLKYTYEEAQKLVLEALAPLGSEYVKTVNKAINERWIDVYPNTGKRSGAYSNGGAFDVHPYILMNFDESYSGVSTMAHELGHTMHSYFSNKTQPYPRSRYTTFVAEVASTFNEVLLFNYMIKNVKDDDIKLSLLMNWLDGFKGTLFRQTQFAEFEQKIHEEVEKGKPLTGDYLSEIYGNILNKYYGNTQKTCVIDDYIKIEWAYIPHFYMNFYVYQYSTSFTASMSLAEKVMNKEPGAVEKYLKFLSSGGSDYPINLLKNAGVDMTTSVPFDKTIQAMNKVMDEIETILNKKEKK